MAHTLDYIAVPRWFYENSTMKVQARVWRKSGRSIQLARTTRLIDHMPVALSMVANNLVLYHRTFPRIDRGALLQCLLKGHRRHEFVDKINSLTTTTTDQWEDAKNQQSVSKQYQTILKVLNTAMVETFPKRRKENKPEIVEARIQRNECLQHRRNVMITNWTMHELGVWKNGSEHGKYALLSRRLTSSCANMR